ncbi:Nn.00g069980.m01.CDS01 [Neocucurbitaria sp. VM-36]
MFQFVTVTHPDQIKDRKRQSALRQHAIRNGIRRVKADRVQGKDMLVLADIDRKSTELCERSTPPAVNLCQTPSKSLLDPFNALRGCPERLHAIMRHPSAKQAGEPVLRIGSSAQVHLQKMNAIFKGALTDPALFHALSLVLALAANYKIPNVEILTYRGKLLNGLRLVMQERDWAPKVSHITAMLLLIGWEYHIHGASCDSISAHIQAMQMIIKMYEDLNVAVIDQVQRALFWQDLMSCLLVGTPRLLSHNDYQEFRCLNQAVSQHDLPMGFSPLVHMWPVQFAAILQDLHGICTLVDACDPTRTLPDNLRIDDAQANLESRLVDLLSDMRHTQAFGDPIYEACMFAVYLCAYKLSTGIWMGCYCPEICVIQILRCVAKAAQAPLWETAPGLLLWLLCVSGGLTERHKVRKQVAVLIQRNFPPHLEDLYQDWGLLKGTLRDYVWSQRAMEKKILRLWQVLNL